MVPLEKFVNRARSEANRLIAPPAGSLFANSYPFFALDFEECERLAFLMSICSATDRSQLRLPAPSVLVLLDAKSAAVMDSRIIADEQPPDDMAGSDSWSFASAMRRSFVASMPHDALKNEMRSLLEDVRASCVAKRFDLRTYRMYLSLIEQSCPAAWVPLYEKYSL